MKKLLRILFVMSAIAFIATVTAWNTRNSVKGTPPSILKFKAEAKGVTIDTTKDVVKITINPSLLDYAEDMAPIFEVTFADKQKGLIVATNVDKAADLVTNENSNPPFGPISTRSIALNAMAYIALNGIGVYNVLTDAKPGFFTQINNKKLTKLRYTDDLYPNDQDDGKFRVGIRCSTMMTGINAKSFATAAPAAGDDLAIGNNTETTCYFRLKTYATKRQWATAAVELADKNLQKVNFVGIVTGDDKASAISKVAPSFLGNNITAEDSAKLVEKYNSGFQKVEIVIAEAK